MHGLSFGPLETVVVEGLPPFKSISISVSAEEAVRSANGDFVIIGSGVPVQPGQETRIIASGDVMLTGYVRDVETSYDAEGRTLSCSFASRTVDFVECSADHASGEILQKDLVGIAKELDSHGIGIETDGATLEVEARHKLRPGESAFHSIERRSRGRGLLIHDTPEGRIRIASKPAGQHAGVLMRGVNILPGASASFSERGRYSDVKVRGQTTEGLEKQQLRGQATAKDGGVSRKRVLILPHEGEATTGRLRKRAAWQARRAAGNGVTASIPVTGWRDAAGKLWTPNMLVQIEDDWLGLSGLMIIKSVLFEQSDMTSATLSLADPRALGGENPRGKTAGNYAAPAINDGDYEDE
ncbi:prophage tail gpP-like protein [Agrobacterium vitis]|nr:prophage tail gpP-like protein [Agrobacterium vitis]MBE1437084.1 prophage tail gpP-like protein [Agrobacterium vitis]